MINTAPLPRYSYDPVAPCLGCGCEPEVVNYFRRGTVRCGYHCTCGATVIDNIYVGNNPFTDPD